MADGLELGFQTDILDSFPCGALLVERNEQIVYRNSLAVSLFERFGLKPDISLRSLPASLELFASATFDRAPEAPLDKTAWPVYRALAGEKVDLTEFGARTVALKKMFWLECSAQPLFCPDGDLTGAIFTLHDITKRKKRELAAASADHLRDFIYRGNVAGILHSTIDGRVIDCNEAMVRMLGYASREELQATREQQLYFDPHDRDRMLRAIRGPKQLDDFEICYRRRDNSRCWGLSNIRLLDSPSGEVGGSLIATIMDITERKHQEDTLRQSEQRFAAFMRNLPGVAFIKDLNGKYVYFSDTSLTLLNKATEEIVGRTDAEVWPGQDTGPSRASDVRVIESGRPIEVIEPSPGPNGVHSWRVNKFPILEDDHVVLVGGIGIDITEQQTLEQQLDKARKMEALGRLAGGVAHDFNNVLTVISGYGQLALEGVDNAPPEQLSSYLTEILTSARRAVGLTGQLLAFSRRQVVAPRVLDLADLLRKLERLLQRVLGENVELSLRCGDQPCFVRIDAHQIEQVIMNLAANARDAMPLGGELRIACRVLAEPRERKALPPLGVIVEISDTGIGMDESVRSQLFEPFFSSKEKGKGTGLGLSTAYGVIAQADGDIEVESQPGVGTTFRIYLPLAEGVPEAALPAVPELSQTRQQMVLLVEDESSVRMLTETMLRRLGYDVIPADCGSAALDLWGKRSKEVDILLTDVVMPHMSGKELADKLRALRPDLKVLFMSGYTDDIIADYGLLQGQTQLIPKPFTSQDLGQKLRAVLDA